MEYLNVLVELIYFEAEDVILISGEEQSKYETYFDMEKNHEISIKKEQLRDGEYTKL